MNFNALVCLAIMLLCGLLCGRLAKLFKLPNVTGYLVAGLLLGPCVSGVFSVETTNSLSVISEISLAFIAFTIGGSFKRSYFKRVGIAPVVIAVLEAMVAVFLVQGVLIAIGAEPAFAIVLGAIAAATAPAATLMIIKQYRANGPVTEMLMSVVALDDAVALIAFSFAVTIAKSMMGVHDNILLSILKPFGEVLLSLLIGTVCGLAIRLLLKFFKKSGNRLIIVSGLVFAAAGVCNQFGLSSLLACMMCGAVLCNVSSESDSLIQMCDYVTPPLFLMFFVVSGAQLNLTVLPRVGIVGAVYVVVRVIGKIAGASLGAALVKTEPAVKKYLGWTLIPQAGVAIGLTLVAQTVVPEFADQIRAVVLCGTLIYELIGPVATKCALLKAKEIKV